MSLVGRLFSIPRCIHSLLCSKMKSTRLTSCDTVPVTMVITSDSVTHKHNMFYNKFRQHKLFVSSSSFFSYPFPDVAALADLPYTSRVSAVCPILQTLAPIQSPISPYPKISLVAFFCSLFLLVLISPVFGVFLNVRNNLTF